MRGRSRSGTPGTGGRFGDRHRAGGTTVIKEKTSSQVRCIFGLAKKQGLDKEEIESIAGKRISMLSFAEANDVIKNLGGDPFAKGTPRRTINQHRQQAGVPQI